MSKVVTSKTIVRRYVDEVQNGHRIEALETIFSQGFIDHTNAFGGVFQGIEGLKQGYVEMLEAFPDFNATIHDQICEGDKVVTFKTITGTHEGTFLGIPATGKKIKFKVIDIFRIEENLITECWFLFEELQLMQQLGAISNGKDN
jgi:steroid delta-isomerase-like uncharacterized protein